MRTMNGKVFFIPLGLVVLFSIVIIALAAVALGVIINRLDSSRNDGRLFSLAEQIKSEDLMKHLTELQVIADLSNGTRAVGTAGFNGTLN